MRFVGTARFLGFVGVSVGISTLAASYEGFGPGSLPPETVARYAPPALDEKLRRRVEAVLDLRAPFGGKISPKGGEVFFSWDVTGMPQVWKTGADGGFPLQLTGGEDPTWVEDITPDGRFLVLERDRKGEENPGLYLQPVAGGELIPIQHKAKVQTSYAFTSRDSRFVYFQANDVKADSYALYRFVVETRAVEPLFSEPGLWYLIDQREDGAFLLSKRTGALASEIYLVEPGGAFKPKPLFGQGENREHKVYFGTRAGEYFVQTPLGGDFRRLYLWRDGKFQNVADKQLAWDVDNFWADRAGRQLWYVVNEGGYTRLHRLDARTLKPLKTPSFAGADHVTVSSLSDDGRYAVLAVENSRQPRTLYVFDAKTGETRRAAPSATPERTVESFAESSVEAYTARDGARIPMVVRRPKNCGVTDGCAVIVVFHGGPEGQSKPGFQPRRQLFVDAGFVVVEPNVRGSDGYGDAWIKADDGPKRLDVITDIEDCAVWIRKQWGRRGKPIKIGVMGWSYGGYSTLMAMSRFAGAYDAGVSLVGMSNLVTFLNNTAPYRRALRITEYGDPVKDKEALDKLSPVTYLDKIQAPLLIVHGVSDPRVPAGEALQIHESLRNRSVPSELILLADEGHGAVKRDGKAIELGASLAFFEKYLK